MMFDDFLESSWRSSWMMNCSLEWQFLDEYTFFSIGDAEKRAVGIVIDGETIYTASISIDQNDNGKRTRATLSYNFKDINVESIELKRPDRFENSRRDF